MITVLSGGTGTPKLIQGLLKVVDEKDLSVIVNTAEDHWLPHGYFSPDIDTVVYTVAGIVDDCTWHGIKGDTHITHDVLRSLGSDEYLRIGDRDRATHIWRGELMRDGKTLSEVTRMQCKALGVESNVLPMSDDRVETVIETPQGALDLHEFWVKNRGEPNVNKVYFNRDSSADACSDAAIAIRDADRIVIGPSNPVTSIHPIISLPQIDRLLRKHRDKTIAVSPLVGGSAFSGSAEKLMRAFDIDVSISGIAKFYRDYAAHLIVDTSEKTQQVDGVNIHKTGIVMNCLDDKKSLAEYVLGILL